MRDHWLDEPHDSCRGGCAFLLHAMLDRYTGAPAGSARQTALDNAIVHMFEERLAFDFVLEDIHDHVEDPSNYDHYYRLRAAQQRVPVELQSFNKAMGQFYAGLGSEQRAAVGFLDPIGSELSGIAGKMRRLRKHAAHAKCGVHGILDQADSVLEGEDTLESLTLLSAHLVGTLVDGAMHALPGLFSHALDVAHTGDMDVALPDHRTFPDTSEQFRRGHPVTAIPPGSLDAAGTSFLPRLAKARWAFRLPIPMMSYINCVQVAMPNMPLLWTQLWRLKLAFWTRYVAIELANFFDLYADMRSAGLIGERLDAAVLSRQDEVRRLRDLAAHWRSPSRFSLALGEGIGYGDFLLVTGWAAEWARTNANSRQDEIDRIPPLGSMVRRYAFAEAANRAERLRSRAMACGGAPGG